MKFNLLRRPKATVLLIFGALLSVHILIVIFNNFVVTVEPAKKERESKAIEDNKPSLNWKKDAGAVGIQNLGDSSRKVAAKVDKETISYDPDTQNDVKLRPRPAEKLSDIIGRDERFIAFPPLNRGAGLGEGGEDASTVGIPKYVDFGHAEDFEDDCDEQYCTINGRKVNREMIRETPGDMFTNLPPEETFLKEFRNPCWKSKDPNLGGEEKLFCIPYFYIIGVTKSGTTDMFHVLRNHTLVSSRAGKESHYFDRQRRGRISKMNRPPSRSPMSFMAFANSGRFRENLISTYKPTEGSDVLFHGITMDATPSHVWDNEFWEVFHPGYREPPVTNADVIAALYSKTKIIVSLRGPIARMQSAYQFFCAFRVYDCDRPITPEKFHWLVVDAVAEFNKCLETNTPRGCVYSTDTHQLATHLYGSIYSVYMADWLAVFPRDQVHVIMFEEHIADEMKSIQSICDFLEIPRYNSIELRQYLEEHKVRNSLKDSKKIPYVLPQTTELLLDFFKPFLSDLVKLLGDDKWDWNYYK